MSASPLLCLFVAVATTVVASPPALANRFDFIYPDSIFMEMDPGGGFGSSAFGLVVNTGTEAIVDSAILHVTFEVTATHPEIIFTPATIGPHQVGPPFAPILPGEAVGIITATFDDSLLTLVRPGETYREDNNGIGFGTLRAEGSTYEGEVRFDIRMSLAGEEAVFSIYADVHPDGPGGNIRIRSAGRASSKPLRSTADLPSWGQLKALYR